MRALVVLSYQPIAVFTEETLVVLSYQPNAVFTGVQVKTEETLGGKANKRKYHHGIL